MPAPSTQTSASPPATTERGAGERQGPFSAQGRRLLLLTAGCLLAGIAGAALGMLMGRPNLSPAEVIEALRGTGPVHEVVANLRAPRILLGLLAGAALGMAGALLQATMRNPLAAPDLLGVSGGCSLVVACVAILGAPIPRSVLPLAATAGGLAVGLAVVYVGRHHADPAVLLLTGLACSTFLSGCVIAILTLAAPSDVGLFYQYLLGSLANRSWDDVSAVAPWVVLCVPAGILLSRHLNLLRLGDDVASSLGASVQRTRRLTLVLACGLTATVVAVSGPISFVALIAPHVVRRAVRTTDAWVVTSGSAVVGAVLLMAADQMGRAAAYPREVAVGVWTVLLGAPVLMMLLRTRRATV